MTEMTKAILSLYFVVWTLAAPWVCCCTFRMEPTSVKVANEAGCCCCNEPTKSDDSAPSQSPQKHECPCRAERPPMATIAKTTIDFSFTLVDAVAELDSVPAVATPAVCSIQISQTPQPEELRVRLSQLCLLRC